MSSPAFQLSRREVSFEAAADFAGLNPLCVESSFPTVPALRGAIHFGVGVSILFVSSPAFQQKILSGTLIANTGVSILFVSSPAFQPRRRSHRGPHRVGGGLNPVLTKTMIGDIYTSCLNPLCVESSFPTRSGWGHASAPGTCVSQSSLCRVQLSNREAERFFGGISPTWPLSQSSLCRVQLSNYREGMKFMPKSNTLVSILFVSSPAFQLERV